MSEKIFGMIPGDTWANIDAALSGLTLLLVFLSWFQSFKNNQEIKIAFEIIENKQKKYLPTYILRKNVTRAEIAGILGFYRRDMAVNHKVDHLSKIEFFKDIQKIQNSFSKELIIKISLDELKQFKI